MLRTLRSAYASSGRNNRWRAMPISIGAIAMRDSYFLAYATEEKEASVLLNKFDIQIRDAQDYAVIETEGYLNDALGEALSAKAHTLIQDGQTRLVINLEKTALINSIGISILIEIIETLDERNGTLNFCGLSATQERTFRMMAIAKYAGIFPDEQSAIDNL